MRLRSPLFAPGDSERKMAKAIASAADAVILDLEDSVAAPAKPTARAMVPDVVRAHAGRDSDRPGQSARHAMVSGGSGRRGSGAPGRRDAAQVQRRRRSRTPSITIWRRLEAAANAPIGSIRVVAIVTETAASVFGLGSYAPVCVAPAGAYASEPRTCRPIWASARAVRTAIYPAPVVFARGQGLVAAGALGVPAIDTPYPDHTDPDGLKREAEAAAADGFAGKILIHPAQIDIVNAAFTPPADQVRWAEQVDAAFTANPDSGVFALDGKMIDRPHWKLAQRILAAAGA